MFAILLAPLLVLQASAAVPLEEPYDPGNAFATILADHSQAAIVLESSGALAFMDRRPAAPGHVLVIPKAPVRNLMDASDDALADVMALARCVAIAQAAAFKADGATGVALRQNNGPPAQHVGHLHLHLIPQYAAPPTPAARDLTPAELQPVADRIRAYLPAKGCPSVKESRGDRPIAHPNPW